jgi:hypothetical protein
MAQRRRLEDYPEILEVRDVLRDGRRQALISIFVCNNDRKHKPLDPHLVGLWTDKAFRIFGRMYGGATAFTNLRGIYHPEEYVKRGLRPHFDEPTMIQSLTDVAKVDKDANLTDLGDLCRSMGQSLNQTSVGVVINQYFVDIEIEHED